MSKFKRLCPVCERTRVGPIRIWRRYTQYTQFYRNYLRACVHCIREDDYDYHFMWLEYYASQGYWQDLYYKERWATGYVMPIPVKHVHSTTRIC